MSDVKTDVCWHRINSVLRGADRQWHKCRRCSLTGKPCVIKKQNCKDYKARYAR